MLTALLLLVDRLLVVAHVAVGATALVLAPIAYLARERRGGAAVLRSRPMTPARSSEPCARTWRRDARSIVILTLACTAVHAVEELRQGCLSIPCLAGAAIGMGGALTIVAACVSRMRGRTQSGVRAARLALLAGVVAGIAMTFVAAGLQRATGLDLLWDPSKPAWTPVGIAFAGAMQGIFVSALWGIAVEYPFALDEARRRAVEADRALRDAELARLRGCLEPHFLLNALHAVAGLVDDEPRVARRLLAALGDLYRDALSRSDEVQPLAVEVAWLRRYAEILEVRHAGALAFKWEIDRDAEKLAVPTLLLQPLVENAVKHGALAVDGAGEVVVRAHVDRDALTCVVEDDGPGPSATPRDGAQGLSIVKQRLAVRYGGRASFSLEASGGRTRAVVRLPLAEVA